MKYGRKVAIPDPAIDRSIDARMGLLKEGDRWPERFYQPLKDGSAKGAALSKEKIDDVLRGIYDLSGWDKKSGLPTKEKLKELGLKEEARITVSTS